MQRKNCCIMPTLSAELILFRLLRITTCWMPPNADYCHQNTTIHPRADAAFNDLGAFNIVNFVPLMPFISHPSAGHQHTSPFFHDLATLVKVAQLIGNLSDPAPNEAA